MINQNHFSIQRISSPRPPPGSTLTSPRPSLASCSVLKPKTALLSHGILDPTSLTRTHVSFSQVCLLPLKDSEASLLEVGEETSSCGDCVSGPKSCTCSSDVACSVDAEYLVHLELEVRSCLFQKFLDISKKVTLEEDCQNLCVADPDCSW